MKRISSKIYYFISTGEVLAITSEGQGNIEETNKEQDMESYPQLKGKSIDEVDFIELDYGTLASIFNSVKSYSINLETKTLECIYITQAELDAQKTEQEEQQVLAERINTISDYASLDTNSIAVLENAIIEYETNVIMGGM